MRVTKILECVPINKAIEVVQEYRTYIANKINFPEEDMEVDEVEEVTKNDMETSHLDIVTEEVTEIVNKNIVDDSIEEDRFAEILILW